MAQGGLVEEINLRTIVLRDEEGTVHVFPNGAITTLANRSKDFSYYVITLAIPYHEDADRVSAVLRDVGAELQKDTHYGVFILEPIEIMGVDAFLEWSVQIKLRIKTVPQRQHEVGRELRKRIRRALDQQGIAVPFPDRLVAVREGATRADGCWSLHDGSTKIAKLRSSRRTTVFFVLIAVFRLRQGFGGPP